MSFLYRHLKCLLLSLSVLLPITTILSADEIVLYDGTMISGTIIQATKESISIEIGDQIQSINRTDVLTVRFSRSDLIVLMEGNKIEGKIINKEGDDVIVAMASEIKNIDNSTIKQVFYNVGSTLQLAYLPPTGRQFRNDPGASVVSSEFRQSISGNIVLGFHFPVLKDWREQFFLENGKHPETDGIQIGGKVSYAFNKNISLEGGYEHFIGPKIKIEMTEPNFTDKISYDYVYAGAKFSWPSRTNLTIRYCIALDGGLLTGKEEIIDMEEVDLEALSEGIVARISAGVEYYTSQSTSLTVCLSFLMANLEETKMLGLEIPDYAHNFTGPGIFMSYNLHVPLSF
ncbi:hypothetical protein ACFL6Q_02130 [Candidatus Neomarinimicrobiota bacterium]